MEKKFSLNSRLKSFSFAFRGLSWVLQSEHNVWLHLSAAILAVLLGFIYGISRTEWLVIVLIIGIVFSAELMNSAIERLMDVVSPGYSEKARIIKDISAGAVLISALMAVVAGAIIYIPYIIH